MALRKQVSTPGPYSAGDTVTFTITVFNQGSIDATGVEITEYVPTGMTNVDGDWTGNTFTIDTVTAGSSVSVDIDLEISPSFTDTLLTNNAEITSATNALGLTDQDSDLTTIDGSIDDTSEIGTDDDIDDEAPGTPGTVDNPLDVDDYDPTQITVGQIFDLALRKQVSTPGPYSAEIQ